MPSLLHFLRTASCLLIASVSGLVPYSLTPHVRPVYVNISVDPVDNNKLHMTRFDECFQDDVIYFQLPRYDPKNGDGGSTECQIAPSDFVWDDVFNGEHPKHIILEDVETDEINCMYRVRFDYGGKYLFTIANKFSFIVDVLPARWREWERRVLYVHNDTYHELLESVKSGGDSDDNFATQAGLIQKPKPVKEVRAKFMNRTGRVLGVMSTFDFQQEEKFTKIEYRRLTEFAADFMWQMTQNLTDGDVVLSVRNNHNMTYLTVPEAVLRTQPSLQTFEAFEVQSARTLHSVLGAKLVFADDKQDDLEPIDAPFDTIPNTVDKLFWSLCDVVVVLVGKNGKDVTEKLSEMPKTKTFPVFIDLFKSYEDAQIDGKNRVLRPTEDGKELSVMDMDEDQMNTFAEHAANETAWFLQTYEQTHIDVPPPPLDFDLTARMYFHLERYPSGECCYLAGPNATYADGHSDKLEIMGIYQAREVTVKVPENIKGDATNVRFAIFKLIDDDPNKWTVHKLHLVHDSWVAAPEGTWHVCATWAADNEDDAHDHACSDFLLNIGTNGGILRGEVRSLDSSKILDNIELVWKELVEKVKRLTGERAMLQTTTKELERDVDIQEQWLKEREQTVISYIQVANLAHKNVMTNDVRTKGYQRILNDLVSRYDDLTRDKQRLEHIVEQFEEFDIKPRAVERSTLKGSIAKIKAQESALDDLMQINNNIYDTTKRSQGLLDTISQTEVAPEIGGVDRGYHTLKNVPLARERETREAAVNITTKEKEPTESVDYAVHARMTDKVEKKKQGGSDLDQQ